MTTDIRAGVALNNSLPMSHPTVLSADGRNGETPSSSSASSSAKRDGDFTVPATPPVASARALPDSDTSEMMKNGASDSQPHHVFPSTQDSMDGSSTGVPQTIPNSQESHMPDINEHGDAADSRERNGFPNHHDEGNSGSQLLQLSAIAAAQGRMDQDSAAGSRKRTANGQVKAPSPSRSPAKGHARSASAMSMGSTGSHIGDMSADLKTRLSYAMMKVSHGWQSRSLDEVESLASRAASPASSSSTIHLRKGSSSSPRLGASSSAAQVHFAPDTVMNRRKSNSPPESPDKPGLAPPAPIQPAMSNGNTRRNANPRATPALLSHSHSASSHSHHPSAPAPVDTGVHSLSQPTRPTDSSLYSPHHNVRDQDAIDALLFMSSPGNSANMKHAFSPSVSPAPQQGPIRSNINRHALPSGPRRGLPGQRPQYPQKKVGFEKSPLMPPPDSPMDLDSPQQYHSPNQWTPKRRANGTSGHFRGALSLPSGLGVGGGRTRKSLRDEDIERILDHAAADSSDDEEIQLPARQNSVARPVGI